MTASTAAHHLQYWRMAQVSPFGFAVRTTDPALAKRQLYTARAKAADPSLNAITIRTSPEHPSTDLWLVRDRASAADRSTDDPVALDVNGADD